MEEAGVAGLILAGCLLPSSSFFWLEMNLALLHDRRLVQTFWEEKISSRSRNEEDEEQRLERSALTRLRAGWLTRLEARNKHLRSLNTETVKSSCSADPS